LILIWLEFKWFVGLSKMVRVFSESAWYKDLSKIN
jgi:hypothetical protein